MEKTVQAFGVAALAIGGMFFFIILATLMGALAGWTVGLVFGDTILYVLSKFGITDVTMWQFGAFMGFVGGFLKTKVSVSKS